MRFFSVVLGLALGTSTLSCGLHEQQALGDAPQYAPVPASSACLPGLGIVQIIIPSTFFGVLLS
jgi:hypothetical protein